MYELTSIYLYTQRFRIYSDNESDFYLSFRCISFDAEFQGNI